jgi:hypothetical protein
VNRRHDTPWAGRALVVVVVLNVIGVGAIVGGWLWASGRTVLADQFPAANLTVVGLIVAGAGNVAWLLSGRRAVGRAKVALFGPLGDRP